MMRFGCRLAGEQLALEMGVDELQRRVGEKLAEADAAEQGHALLGEPALEDLGQLGAADDVDLVDDRAEHRHAMACEERRVERDLVDRTADAALADDDHR